MTRSNDNKPWTSAQLMVALAARYKSPEFALLPQVRNGTGYSRSARTADAIAMSLWPSRGLELLGFELKSARHDWMREKGDPAKAEEIASRCDRWWIVAGAIDVVETEELPPTWGLLAVDDRKLKVVKEAPKLEGGAIDRAFLAALLRKTAKNIDRSEIEAAVALAREEGRVAAAADAERNAPFEIDSLRRRLDEIKKRVEAFEEKSGVKIDHWNYENVAEAVHFLTNTVGNDGRDPVEQMRRVVRESARVAEEAAKALAAIESRR
jgi:hypothetical protein